MVQTARGQGFDLVEGLHCFYHSHPPRHGLALGFGAASVPAAMRTLDHVLATCSSS